MPVGRYRELTVAGEPREMGRQIGQALRDEIAGFAEIALHRVNKMVAVSRQRALEIARQSLACAAEYSPDMVAELEGVSESSGVSLEELMLLQVRNQLTPEERPGCTSVSVLAGEGPEGSTIVAQNWDNDPVLDLFTVVLTRKPRGRPALMNVTQAGLIAYIGLNDAGLGLCLNTLPAPSRPVGVPHYFTVRGIYESRSLAGAIEAVRRARRAIPANIMLATPEGPFDLEVTLEEVQVLPAQGGLCLHTNHCLHPELLAINEAFPELIESYPRLRRMGQLLSGARGGIGVRQLQQALRDHEGFPRSICRHVNDDPKTGFWQTVFSVIIEPQALRMHVTRGTPCDRDYETYVLN